ncbi:hypothetical protein [Mesorhizobium sp.]|uniref:hypothetical protein n=1 Tax=Mesorhizobium sp. TaxID=1871066 RepID=UPI0025C67916|nr:hypothetical protein [Mesorhizobium sp.]
MLASVGVLLATLSPVTAVEKLRASDKAALAECLKYVGDFQGGVPGVNDTPHRRFTSTTPSSSPDTSPPRAST